jgi:hypothetical protein
MQSAAALTPALALARSGTVASDPLERMTAGKSPAIAVSQVGFRPETKKRVLVRQMEATSFQLEETGGSGFKRVFSLRSAPSELERLLLGDFSDVTQPGKYLLRVGAEVSPPFSIAADVWRRHLPLVVSYHKAQRCGVAVPGVHPACHLDDARRRDSGQHVDTTGGWHDAGDLRKWMDATMMNAFGLFGIVRNLGAAWDTRGAGLTPLEEELRWGNAYFLKMQDTDGQVWADVAGGVNGDNSDNHWTDNVAGTADDRYLNTSKGGSVQPMFTALQAMYADHFRADAAYRNGCLQAARNCWIANQHDGDTEELAWWLLAAVELFRATQEDAFAAAGKHLAARLLALQRNEGNGINGYWLMSKHWDEPYRNPTHAALPAFVLLEAARVFAGGDSWREAVKRHIENYVVPMMAKSAYGIMPFGMFTGSPTAEVYRPLNSRFTYRYFMSVKKQFWWLGLNAHLGSYALLLATAARDLGEGRWREMAYRQLEWMFGANPFSVSLASGIGTRVARPFSVFVGVIPGGIMNGVCGNADDEPVLDLGRTPSWRSNEYWSPPVGYFEWSQSVLEASQS